MTNAEAIERGVQAWLDKNSDTVLMLIQKTVSLHAGKVADSIGAAVSVQTARFLQENREAMITATATAIAAQFTQLAGPSLRPGQGV